MEEPNPRESRRFLTKISVGFGLCFEIIGSVIAGAWIGSWFDRRLDSKPWAMIVCVLVFLGVSFFHLVRVLQKLDKEDNS
jgi:F0F1-type ATP synthase assembly protein I